MIWPNEMKQRVGKKIRTYGAHLYENHNENGCVNSPRAKDHFICSFDSSC